MAKETEALFKIPTPAIPEKKGRLAASDILGVKRPYIEEKARIQQGITKATGEEAKAKQAQTELLAEKTMGVEQQAAQQERAAREGYVKAVEKEPLPAFVPTQDSARDMAGLFSLINVMGVLMGGGGKQASIGALGAMNGMLEGYQKGRADLYKKERDLFDKNFKVMQQKHAELRREMEDAIKLAATDRQAGMAAAQLAAAKSGSSMLQAQLRRGELLGAYKLIEESQTGANKALDFVVKQKEAEAREAAANERARLQREQQAKLAADQNDLRERLAKIAAEAKGKGGALKPPAKVTEAYIADNQLKADIKDITNDLKNNPELVKKLEKYRVEAFLTEEGKVLNQLVSGEIPSDLRQFLTKVSDLRNNYYLNISGKAVTGGEALRSYGTVPQRGDDAQGMIDKLTGMSNRVNQAISIKQQLYGLPELDLNAGNRTSLVPNENYGIGNQTEKYQLNQVITQGKKKYRVIDVTDPNDPELEEIQ
jgi:hypothetical protein